MLPHNRRRRIKLCQRLKKRCFGIRIEPAPIWHVGRGKVLQCPCIGFPVGLTDRLPVNDAVHQEPDTRLQSKSIWSYNMRIMWFPALDENLGFHRLRFLHAQRTSMSVFAQRKHGDRGHEVVSKVADAHLHVVVHRKGKNTRQGGNGKGILVSKKEQIAKSMLCQRDENQVSVQAV